MWLIILLGLHHLGDTIQPPWLIENKKKYLWAHWEHAFTWAFLVTLGLIAMENFALWKFFFLWIVHLVIDSTFYIVLPHIFGYRKYGWVWIDQALHYLQILIVWL